MESRQFRYYRIFICGFRLLDLLLQHVALFHVHGAPSQYWLQEVVQMSQVSETTVDRAVDTSHMKVSSTNVAIEVIGMHKWYADFHVLRDINLKVMEGERIVIAGPSGSGKSTLIRCINRLEEHQ